jgi:small subunit ribosomal protein S1
MGNPPDAGSGPDEDFAALFAESEKKARVAAPRQRLVVGQLVRARVVSIGREAVVVEIEGGKTEAMLDLADLRDEGGEITVAVGAEVEARVLALGEEGGGITLRRAALGRGPDSKAELMQAFQHGIPVEGTVTGVNKGGVEVSVAGARAFCPISQLEARHVEDAQGYVGQKLTFRITRYETDKRGTNIVLSRRALLEEEARTRAVETRARLAVGAVLPGVVTALKDFGAFVDLGGIEGMLHVSELGFERTLRPSDVLSIGQRLEVQVLRIEKRNDAKRPEQIALSLKSLHRDPWEDVGEKMPEGSRLTGTVTRVEPFGAFVAVAPGIEGLLHVEELGGTRQIRHAREVVKPGQSLQVSVLALDRDKRRLSLGLVSSEDSVDDDGRAAAQRVAAPGKLGTLGDLFKGKDLKPR